MLLDAGAGQTCPDAPLASAPPAPPMSPLAPPTPWAPFSPPGYAALGGEEEVAGCPPVGPCLGYAGNCADLQEQFIELQGCYFYGDPGAEEYHEFLDEYRASLAARLRRLHAMMMLTHLLRAVCHAFPDDAYITDQFFVGLISVAGACPPLSVACACDQATPL
jgi:hypothetical protein